MGGDDRGRIDHGVAGQHCFFLVELGHPERRQVKGRFPGFHALDAMLGVARVHGQVVVDEDFGRGHLVALDEHDVLAGAQLKIVAQVQRGDDHAHVQGELAADGADAGQQVAVLLLVDQRDEPVADFEFQGVQRQQGLDLFRGFEFRGRLFLLFGGLSLEQLLLLAGQPGHHEEQNGHGQEGEGRQAGHDGEQEQHPRDQPQGARVEGQLGHEFFAHLGFGGGPGDNEAGRGGDDDGRDDGDQTVADG